MDTERCRFVFGVDVAPVDIDDDDELFDWVQRVIAPTSEDGDLSGLTDDLELPDDVAFEPPEQAGSLLAYVPVIRQILGDELPEAWEAAKRCVAAGSDDRDALGELAIVMMHHLEELLGAGGADGRNVDEVAPAHSAFAAIGDQFGSGGASRINHVTCLA